VELSSLSFPLEIAVAFISAEELPIEFALMFAVVFAVVFAVWFAVWFDSGISEVLTATSGAIVVEFTDELTATSWVVAFERPKKPALVELAANCGSSVAVESPPHPDKIIANADTVAMAQAFRLKVFVC